MSDNRNNHKEPSKRESRRDRWAMDVAKSGGIIGPVEFKGPTEQQPAGAKSSSNGVSLTDMGQRLLGAESSKDASIAAIGQRLPTSQLTVAIQFPHGEVCLPWPVVGRFPVFAAMFEGGILKWPGISQRQAQIITHYLQTGNYNMVPCNILIHEERLEREFADALAVNAQAAAFHLPELSGLALTHMEQYGNMISLTRILVNFMAQGEWYQRNGLYVIDYVIRRSTSTIPPAFQADRREFRLQTGDPLIDGLVGAINSLRFPYLPSPPPPPPPHRHY